MGKYSASAGDGKRCSCSKCSYQMVVTFHKEVTFSLVSTGCHIDHEDNHYQRKEIHIMGKTGIGFRLINKLVLPKKKKR